jgi:hypothetical protein
VVGRTVDDVVRHYLSETGGEAGVRAPVVPSTNRAIRLRGAVDAALPLVAVAANLGELELIYPTRRTPPGCAADR